MNKQVLRVAISAVALCFATASSADEAAAKKWIDQEFQPATLSKDQQLAELKWFIGAANQLRAKGIKEISVVSETITTHEYEAKMLARAFEDFGETVHDLLMESEQDCKINVLLCMDQADLDPGGGTAPPP